MAGGINGMGTGMSGFSDNSGGAGIVGATNGLSVITPGYIGLGGTLTQDTEITTDGRLFALGDGENYFVVGYDTSYLAGAYRLSQSTGDVYYAGILDSFGSQYAATIYQSADANTLGAALFNETTTSFIRYRSLSAQNFAGITIQNENNGLIVAMESRRSGSLIYGFSSHNRTDSSGVSADFYEYSPTLGMDLKAIFITPSGIVPKVLYSVADSQNYSYNDGLISSSGWLLRTGNTVSGGVITLSNNTLAMNTTGQVGIGYGGSDYTFLAKLDIKTGGSTSSDLGFVVRNSADSKNIFAVYGDLKVAVNCNSAPLSTLEVEGSFGAEIATITTNKTLGETSFTVLVDASGGNVTVSLPAANTATRRIYFIKKIDSSGNTVTVNANGSETIDGSNITLGAQYEGRGIQCNGSNWFIISWV